MATCSASSVGVEGRIQAFLEALAAGGGKPMEQMTPTEARAVLVGTQSSVAISLPKVDVTLRTIISDDQTGKLS
jgi:acetyl esterase